MFQLEGKKTKWAREGTGRAVQEDQTTPQQKRET